MEPVRDVDLGYQYMGMSVCTVVAPERGREARNNSVQSRRRRRTVARRIALGVFRLPSCCTAPSTLEDPDPLSDNIGRNPRYAPTGEISPHIPYVPKYIHSREISRLPVKSKLQRKVRCCIVKFSAARIDVKDSVQYGLLLGSSGCVFWLAGDYLFAELWDVYAAAAVDIQGSPMED